MGGFLLIGDYIFSLAYPVAFIGACFYGMASIVNVDPSTVIANKNLSIAINLFIGLCGILSLFSWFSVVGNAPVIGPTLLPNGNRTIKVDRKANSTY